MAAGFVSKIAEEKDPFTVLGNTEISAVTHVPLDAIPQVCKGFDHDLKRSSLVVGEEPSNIFQQKKPRRLNLEHAHEVKEDTTSRILETVAFPQRGKSLAWKTSRKQVEVGQGLAVNFGNVAIIGRGKMMRIHRIGKSVDFRMTDPRNGNFGLAESEFETADAGEGGEGFHCNSGKRSTRKRPRTKSMGGMHWREDYRLFEMTDDMASWRADDSRADTRSRSLKRISV